MITIHGRTRCQFYKGRPTGAPSRAVKDAVQHPRDRQWRYHSTAATARTALAHSGADGVMIGRGAQGKPWLLAQIAA